MSKSYRIIENCEDYTEWTILGNETADLAASTACITGTVSLEFAKVNASATTAVGGAYKTFAGDDVKIFAGLTPMDYIIAQFYISDMTNVDYALLRMGTSATAYLEWRFEDSSMIVGWNSIAVKIGNCNQYNTTTGSWTSLGIPLTDPTYMAVGVKFDSEANALAGIKFDHIAIAKAERTVT